jgi:hypothetical protein
VIIVLVSMMLFRLRGKDNTSQNRKYWVQLRYVQVDLLQIIDWLNLTLADFNCKEVNYQYYQHEHE